MPSRSRLAPPLRALSAATIVLASGPTRATEAVSGRPEQIGALAVVADLTLIDGACRGDSVNFGIAFGFAEQHGVAAAAILPGGSERAAFEGVLRDRRAGFAPEELCGEIAENYAQALPGSVTFPTGTIRGR